MFRRTLRIGVRLGLLLGITFAVVKTVQLRRASSATGVPEPWEPIPAPRPVDEVGEPILESAPADPAAQTPEPEPLATDVPPAGPLTPADLEIGTQPAGSSNGSSTGPSNGAAAAPTAPAKKTAKRATKAAKKATKKTGKAPAQAAWVEPVGGTCPPTHPVKAKVSSLIYHLPGMVAYERTRANRCYTDAEAAEADGFVRAKR
ncbi:MAG: hypothetical protein M3P34_05745 [Actinomycetota bacterium]|nr:hypothetical protein [Actinomycetota bacterium]